MRFRILLIGLLFSLGVFAQTDTMPLVKRKATKLEVKKMEYYADSFLLQLKQFYKLEIKENSPRKYQPERISVVRSYLLLYQNLEQTCEVVNYSKSDIETIFGSPDSITVVNKATQSYKWHYSSLQKDYVRINNLRYVFYFKQNELVQVKREY